MPLILALREASCAAAADCSADGTAATLPFLAALRLASRSCFLSVEAGTGDAADEQLGTAGGAVKGAKASCTFASPLQ